MPLYRNIGNETHIGRTELKKLGQTVELTEELARDAILGGAAILPESDYPFSAEEEKKYGTPGSQMQASAEFLERLKAARVRLHEIREGYSTVVETPSTPVDAPVTAEPPEEESNG